MPMPMYLEEPSAAGPDLAGGHLLVVLDHLHPPQTAGHQAHLALLARHRHRQGVRHKDTAQLFVQVLPRRSHLTVLQLRSLRGPTHNLSHTHNLSYITLTPQTIYKYNYITLFNNIWEKSEFRYSLQMM